MDRWLWISNLDSNNDWLEVTSYDLKHPRDVSFTVDPGRFLPQLTSMVVSGRSSPDVILAFGSQLEYHFLGALLSGLSTSSNQATIWFNYRKLTSSYSGNP